MSPANPEQVQELVDAVTRLVNERYGGDWDAAFRHYALGDSDMDRTEIHALLTDAGIGNRFTRWAWADGILQELDAGRDGAVSFAELQAVMRGN